MSVKFELTNEVNNIQITEGKVIETMCVTEEPSETSVLVEQARKNLLGQLNTEALFASLLNCGELFGIVNDAVDSREGLHVEVWQLREDFSDAIVESGNVVTDILFDIEDVPGHYMSAVNALIAKKKMNKETSLAEFGEITKIAKEVMEKSQELVNVFKDLKETASDAVKKIIAQKALDVTARKDFETKMETLKAKMKSLEVIKDDLSDEIEQVNEDYERLNRRIDKASDQKFWINLTATISNALGSAFSTYAQNTPAGVANKAMAANTNGNAAQATTQESGTSKSQAALDETNKKIADLTTKIEASKTKIEEKTTAINNETDATKKGTLEGEKKTLVDQKEADEKELEKLKVKQETYTEFIGAAGAGFSSLGQGLQQQGQSIADDVANMLERAEKIEKHRTELRKERREVLGQLAEYTYTVEHSVVTKDSMDLAIAALSAAIGALDYIISVLNDFYRFWSRIKSYCANMAKAKIETYFKNHEKSPADLKSLEFLSMVATNASQWVALKVIMQNYQDSFDQVFNMLQKQLKENIDKDPQKMWKRAIEKSKGLGDVIKMSAEGDK